MRPRLKEIQKQLSQMVFGRSTSDPYNWMFATDHVRKSLHKVGDGSSSSVVMAPLLWIGRNFPEAPPALWKRSANSPGEERVIGQGDFGGDHPLIELLMKPNRYYSGSALWTATVIDYNLSGSGYWIKLRDVGRRPRELWWTPSTLLTPKGDEKTFLTHYEYRPGTEPIDIPPEDVVHFRYQLDPNDPRRGRSPLSSLLHEVFTDDEARDFVTALLSNMGVPGVVVSPRATQGKPSPDDVKATKRWWKGAFSGERRGEPLVMSGPTDVSQFGFNPRQMMLREIRRIPEERVTACVGVPAIVAGLGAGLDRSTFTNYREARTAAYEDKIIPDQRAIGEDVHIQLLPDFEPDGFWGYRFGFDLANVRALQEDRTALASRFDTGVRGGWIRVSEARRSQDLEVDDADEIYLRGAQTVEVKVGESMAAPVPTPLSPGSGPAQPPALPPGEQPPALSPAATAGRKGIKLGRMEARLMRALLSDFRKLSNVFADELEEDFNQFGASCEEVYLHMTHQTSGRENGHGEKSVKDIDPKTLATMIVATLRTYFDDTLLRRYEAATRRVLEQTVSTVSVVANLTGGVSDEAQRSLLAKGGSRRGLIDFEQVTRDVIFNAINEGNQLGHNPREIARSIREEVPAGRYVNAGSAYRAQVISRSETKWVQNASSVIYYRESPDVDKCVALDGSDDPECAERDGTEFTFDEAEAEMEKEHPNGTLSFAPVVSSSVEVPA